VIACVSYCSNEEIKTVIHSCVYVILLLHVSALVESHQQACKKLIKKDYLYTAYKNGILDIPEISALHEIGAV